MQRLTFRAWAAAAAAASPAAVLDYRVGKSPNQIPVGCTLAHSWSWKWIYFLASSREERWEKLSEGRASYRLTLLGNSILERLLPELLTESEHGRTNQHPFEEKEAKQPGFSWLAMKNINLTTPATKNTPWSTLEFSKESKGKPGKLDACCIGLYLSKSQVIAEKCCFNFSTQLNRWDFKSEFTQIHIEKLQSESFVAGPNMTGPIVALLRRKRRV